MTPRREMTEVERHLNHSYDTVMRAVRVKRYAALRASYFNKFTGVLYRLGKRPPHDELIAWWRAFVLDNTSRGDWMRDGWLTGTDYWDT